MRHRSLVSGAILLGSAAVLLAGCAAPVGTPTSTPSGAHSSAPKPTAASAPGSRVPVGCADLIDNATVQALAGTSTRIEQSEKSAPTNLLSIAQLQYGAEDCVWDGITADSDGPPGAHLQVDVAPDAKAGFETRFSDLMAAPAPAHPVATENVAGDQSGYWCATDLDLLGSDAPSLTCDAEMLVGNYWVDINVGDVDGLTRTQLTGGLTAALTQIASALKVAVAPPLKWVSLASSPPAACTASARDAYPSTIGLDAHDFTCTWNSATYGSAEYEFLAGGSWALPAIDPVPPGDADYGSTPYVSMTIPGAKSAKVSCGDGTCDAYLAIDNAAVEIVYQIRERSKTPSSFRNS